MPNDSYYPRLHRPPSIFRVVNCRVGPRLRQRREKAAPRRKRCVEEIYDTRDLLHAVQGGLCAICGRPLDPVVHRATTDHVIPVAAGGKDALGNYVLAHGKCNEWKANDIPTGCEMIWLLFVNAKIGAKNGEWFWRSPRLLRAVRNVQDALARPLGIRLASEAKPDDWSDLA